MGYLLDTYKGVRIEDNYITGGWIQAANFLIRSLDQYARCDRNVDFYIGIASDWDPDFPVEALKSRIDKRKIDMNIFRIVCVYKSSSHENVKKIEADLIDCFWEDERLLNKMSGGGGRIPDPDKTNYLYFAFSKSPLPL